MAIRKSLFCRLATFPRVYVLKIVRYKMFFLISEQKKKGVVRYNPLFAASLKFNVYSLNSTLTNSLRRLI